MMMIFLSPWRYPSLSMTIFLKPWLHSSHDDIPLNMPIFTSPNFFHHDYIPCAMTIFLSGCDYITLTIRYSSHLDNIPLSPWLTIFLSPCWYFSPAMTIFLCHRDNIPLSVMIFLSPRLTMLQLGLTEFKPNKQSALWSTDVLFPVN